MAATSAPAGAGDAQAPLPPPEDLSAWLEPIRARHRLPALAGAVMEGDRLVAIGAVGVRKVGSSEPVTIHDCFHIGSCTKSMTATLIATLVEEEHLSWDTTILDVFPEGKASIRPEYQQVTLEQLLLHRSGLPSGERPDAVALFIANRNRSGPIRGQRRYLAQMSLRLPPAAQAGSQFIYSNYGYVVAGAIAEQVAGRPWEDLMRRRLFEPLGVRSAGFGSAGTPEQVDQPWGHMRLWFGKRMSFEPGPDADNPAWLGPAGTVHLSLEDWGRYAALHAARGQGGIRLLGPETFDRLHAVPEGGEYAMGWGVVMRDWGGRVLTHAGSNTMNYAVIWVSPERNFSLLIATNTGDDAAAEACDETAGTLLRWRDAVRTSGEPRPEQ
ncbi:MAG: hypothetical protein AMXMBFR13_47640 [Phycisphaerae bacterium]